MTRSNDTERLTEQLQDLFSSQPLAVLATHHNGQPYSSLVAFAATDDMRELIFATNRSTRKYENFTSDPRVSLLIDNRTNQVSDFHNAMAVTAVGTALEIPEEDKVSFLKIYLGKHGHLEDFVMSPGCAMVRVRVEKYHVVRQFQQVMVYTVEP
jgi:nitroimidazol reductase NimA-like FMN-containing flavoprotein (pyridoxamine 5'-phosphate oxidase superfamily)